MRHSKYFVLLILLCFPFLFAGQNYYKHGGGAISTPICDSCISGLMLSWYCDSETINDVAYSPCGCSAGDTSAVSGDSCTITDGYINSTDGGKYYSLSVDSRDIFTEVEGSVIIKFRIITSVEYTEIWSVRANADNLIRFSDRSGNDVSFYYRGFDFGVEIYTVGNHIIIGEDFYALLRWRQGSSDPALSLSVYAASDTSTALETVTTNTDLDEWTSTPVNDYIGNYSAYDGSVRIYQIRRWNTYDGAAF